MKTTPEKILTPHMLSPSESRTEAVISWLQDEFSERRRRNAAYTLTAFATSLGVNHSQLTRLFNRTRSCSPRFLMALEKTLGPLPNHRLNRPQAKTSSSLVKSTNFSEVNDSTDFNFTALETARFSVIADWEHGVIREVLRLTDAPQNVDEIAERIGLPRLQVDMALNRLMRLGLVQRTPDGRLESIDENVSNQPHTGPTTLTSAAHRKLQKGILTRAHRAIDDISIDHRDQSSMTMAVDSARLAEAADRITKFRRELCLFLEGGDTKDAVYQLSISLFPETLIKK